VEFLFVRDMMVAMSTVHLCDFPKCSKPATFRIVATPYRDRMGSITTTWNGEPYREPGIDTCDEHYAFTHPGKNGGGWWDEWSAPQTGGTGGSKPSRVAAVT
jgi:hypothetical protein